MRRIIYLVLLSGLLLACNETQKSNNGQSVQQKKEMQQDSTSNCLVIDPKTWHPDPITRNSEKSPSALTFTEGARVIFSKKKFESKDYPELEKSADSALYIASVLLNTQEFRDSLNNYTFSCRNYLVKCETKCKKCDDRFNGSVVTDSAYRKKDVSLHLYLDAKSPGSLGSAAMNVYKITSHYPPIRADDRSLPFAYSYGYHIAHEYMHIVGFTHKNHRPADDVAYVVGVVGYKIIKRWHKAKINPMDVKL